MKFHNKKTQRIVSIVICVLLVASMLLSAVAALF